MVDIALSGQSRTRIFSFPWVFGARQDLAISLGGMSAGFALLLMHTLLHWNMIVVWFVWVVCLDTPHFFGTYYRTYLDNREWTQRRGLLLGSLAVFLIGPAMLAAAAALHGLGVQSFKLPWKIWGAGVSLWAYLHITRQHYGVLRLYNRKNNETGSVESQLDSFVLYGYLALCFVGLLFSHPQLRSGIYLAPQAPLPANFWTHPLANLSALTWDRWVFLAAGAGAAALLLQLAVFQVNKLLRGETINLPKLIFLGTVFLLHGVACSLPIRCWRSQQSSPYITTSNISRSSGSTVTSIMCQPPQATALPEFWLDDSYFSSVLRCCSRRCRSGA